MLRVGDGGTLLRRAALLLGWQLCALLLTSTGLCSQRLADLGVRAPTAQSCAAYALLSCAWLLLLRSKKRRRGRARAAARVRRWQWALLALADVEANYLLVRAYQYTDITSVMLLDAFAVPCAMGLSVAFLAARYARAGTRPARCSSRDRL